MTLILLGNARAGQDSSPKPRTITNADRYVERKVNGERISYLYGHVFIDRDSLTASSDTAFYYRDREIYEFLGRVVLTRGAGVLKCRRAIHDRTRDRSDFFGGVRLEEGDVIGSARRGESREQGRFFHLIDQALLVTPDYTVRADTITQDRLLNTGEAFGRVRIMEPEALNLVTGDHAFFDRGSDLAEVDRHPVLTSRQEAGDLLTSVAETMRFFRRDNRVVMIDSVRIHQGQSLATADTAIAFGREHMVLTGHPRVTMSDANTMTGRRIDFFYEKGLLDRVVLVGEARMEDTTPDSMATIYKGLPRMDVLEGDSINVQFRDEEIHRSVVVGSAHSIYTPTDLNDEVATNDVHGDTITIDFRNGRVNRVNVVGGMSGTYRFAKVAAMREMLGQSRRLADMIGRTATDSTALADSLISMALDSLATAGFDTSAANLDFLANAEDVLYSGGSVVFEMLEKAIDIRDDGQLNYGTMKLSAQHINLNTVTRELYAEGDPLIEDSENIAGNQMGYDFGNRTGAVKRGVTTFDGYFYVGEEIKRFPDTTLKICNARMTSCDLEEPHYYFWADKMKMRMGDKVVAKPIALHIGHVPVFALPFYFKSLKSGRQSGILFPSFDFGWSSREGRYIRDFGYYWATNDHLDFIFEGDYNEHQDFAYRLSNTYVKRYSFNGGVDYSRKMSLRGDDRREWQFRWNHNQPTLFDDYKFRSDVKMASTSLSSNDLSGGQTRDIVSGEMKSSAYLSRNFSFMSSSLDASRKEFVNAEDDDPNTDKSLNTMTLPSLSLNFREFSLAKPLRGGAKGSFLGDLARNTSFKQGYNFKLTSAGYELHDEKHYNAGGNWALALRPPRVSIFNVNFSSTASQSWTRNTSVGRLFQADSDTTGYFEDFDEVDEKTSTSLRFSAGVGTSLYGLFPVNMGRIKALRHTMRLNTSYSLSPALRGKQLYSTSVGISLNNRLDLKYLTGDSDSTMTEKKLDGLLDWALGTSYNPKREPGNRWGNISSSLTVKPGQNRMLTLKVANSIDPKNLSLLTTRFNYGLSFSGKVDLGQVEQRAEAPKNSKIARLGADATATSDTTAVADASLDQGFEENPEEYFDGEESSFYDFYNRQGRQPEKKTTDATDGGRFIPFNLNASFSYSYDNRSHTKRSTGNLGLRATLTRTWQLNYTGSFDLVTGNPTRQQFGLKKDLHCWALEFNRTVSSVNSEFGFRIYLKSIPALKFTRGREGSLGALGNGLGGGF